MTPRAQTVKDLKAAGYTEIIHGGKHDRFKNPQTGKCITIKRHDFNENDRKYILRELKLKENGER